MDILGLVVLSVWVLGTVLVCLLLLVVKRRNDAEKKAADNWRRSNYFGDRR